MAALIAYLDQCEQARAEGWPLRERLRIPVPGATQARARVSPDDDDDQDAAPRPRARSVGEARPRPVAPGRTRADARVSPDHDTDHDDDTPAAPRRPRRRAGSGLDDSGAWSPVFNGQRPPFRPADPRVTSHGAYSAAVVGPLVDRVMADLGSDRSDVRSYVESRIRVELVMAHLATLDLRSPDALAASRLLGRLSGRLQAIRKGAGRIPEDRLAAAVREALEARQ